MTSQQAKDLNYDLLATVKKFAEQGATYREIVTQLLNIATILSVAGQISMTDNVKVLEQLYNQVTGEAKDYPRD